MKKKLLLTLAMLLGCASLAKADVLANTKYFPDEQFLAWVLNHFNKIRGSRLTDEELASVKSITSFGDPYIGGGVKSLKGIEYFTELEYLSLRNLNEKYGEHGNTIEELDLSKNKKLKTFYFCTKGFYYGNPDIKISDPFDLLYGYFTGETSKTTSTTDASRFMRLKKVSLANLPELRDVDIESQSLSELDLRGCPNLRTVIVHDCENAVDIKLDTCENLETFAYSKCTAGVKLPDFALMPNLRALMCDDGKLTKIDLSGAPKTLEVLSCSGNLMTSLDLSNCTKLKSLSCKGVPVASLDCSQIDSLKYINLTNCASLRTFPALPSGIATILCDNVKAFANVDPSQYSNLMCLRACWCGLTKFDGSKFPNPLMFILNRNNIAAPSFSGLYYDEDNAEGYRRFDACAQDIYVRAIPVSGRRGYWRILLPDDVDLNRINSYRFSEDFRYNNDCELYMEYYEDEQGNLKSSFVTNLSAVGDESYTRNYLTYYYDTGGTYTYSMYYPEYAIAARTHYQSCKSLYDSYVKENDIKSGGTQDILYRLLYLCGHVIECASIYLIFNHFRYDFNPNIQDWNGNGSHLHRSYNSRFTRVSHMDFYPIKIENGYLLSSYRKTPDGRYLCFGQSRSGESDSDYYCIQSHNFQRYIKNVIHTQLPQDVPYLRPFCPEDTDYSEAIDLIDTWNTDLRYYYDGRLSGHYNRGSHNPTPSVNVENIGLVLKICEKIVNLMPSGRQL